MTKPKRESVLFMVENDEVVTDQIFETIELLEQQSKETVMRLEWINKLGVAFTITVHSNGIIHKKEK